MIVEWSRRRRVAKWALIAGALLVTATIGNAQQTVKIGVLAPLSGPAAADGEATVRGAELAVEDLNAAGGVAGYKFEIVVGDTKDLSSDAVTSAFERLSGDRDVHAIVANYASGTNFEIENMADATMPYLVGANAAQTREMISKNPDDYPTVWSVVPAYDAYEIGVLPYIQKLEESSKLKFANKKLAIISSDNPYSKTIYEGLKKAFTGAGWTVTVDEMVPFGQVNDWRVILAKIRNDPPGLIINTDYLPGNEATFMLQFMEAPTNSLLFIQYAPLVPEFLELTKGKSDGVLYNNLSTIVSSKFPRTLEINRKYKDKYGSEPGTAGAIIYEEIMIYAEALKNVGKPDDHVAIGKAIGETDVVTALGRIQFDPKTHLAIQDDEHVPLAFYQIQDGKGMLLSPAAYAEGEFRAPPWMSR